MVCEVSLKIKSASISICSKFSNCRLMRMAIINLQKGSGKRSKVREKSVKSQGIWIWSGNPGAYQVAASVWGWEGLVG